MQKVDAIAQMTYKLQSQTQGQRDGLNELLSMRCLILILILLFCIPGILLLNEHMFRQRRCVCLRWCVDNFAYLLRHWAPLAIHGCATATM